MFVTHGVALRSGGTPGMVLGQAYGAYTFTLLSALALLLRYTPDILLRSASLEGPMNASQEKAMNSFSPD